MAKTVAYIGEFRFPRGDAASQRILGVSRTLVDCGFNVSIHGISLEKEAAGEPIGVFNEFKYSNFVIQNGSKFRRVLDHVCSGYNTLQLLRRNPPDYIIVAGGYSRYLIPILYFGRRNGIKIIVDVVEWYKYSHLPGGRFGIYALDVHFALTRLIKKCDGVIAISSFLENYYLSAGVNTVRIPIVVDTNDARWNTGNAESFDPDSLNLVYAGVPGNKDFIDVAILGVLELAKAGYRIKLHLIGPSKENIKALLGHNAHLVDGESESIICYGRVNQDDIPSLLSKADFSVLIRPNERYANAGFPTKFVESFAAGLPVIGNLTSDLGLFLKDGETGFVMKDYSVNAFIECAKQALSISKSRRIQMRNAARCVSRESFDYRAHIVAMREFFHRLNH